MFPRQIKQLFIAALLLPAIASATPDKYVGTGSCSSSNCHGSVSPRKASNVLQNEYYTWLKHDKHSQAYTVLLKADAKRMASLMGLGEPSKEPLCLKCHATYVPSPEQRGAKYSVEDGVSCESCHGAAERWLETHAVAGVTHQQNLANGLADTASLDKRAQLCVSCHYGDSNKRVTHNLYGAGHPRLSFELDTYGVLEPKHWVVDEDYIKRKGPYVPLAAWFIGQETLAESAVATLLSPELSRNGTFPELSIFDCYSCHHSLADAQWKRRDYGGKPGRLSVNIASLVMLQHALAAIDRPLAEELGNLTATIQEQFQANGATEALQKTQELLKGSIRPMVMKMAADEKSSRAVMKELCLFGTAAVSPKYEVAEQIGMGIQAAMATSPILAKRHKASLDKLFATLAKPDAFNPEAFVKAAKTLSAELS